MNFRTKLFFTLLRCPTYGNVSERTLTYTPVNYVKKNPGIEGRKKLMSSNNIQEEIDEYFDVEEFEDADFMHLDQTYREHVKEIEKLREREKYMIVKQKYFKTKYPNFLTWYEKEQIRLLHKTDPEEWTVEKLSEGFPALPETVAKIVKSNWTKKTFGKMENHDKSVQKNWTDFRTNKIQNLPLDLVEHLQKFSNRERSLYPINKFKSEATEIHLVKKNAPGGFSEIITSYEKLKTKSSDFEKNVPQKLFPQNNVLKEKKAKCKNMVTLHNLQTEIKEKVSLGKDITYDENLIASKNLKIENNLTKIENKATEIIDEISQNKYNQVSVVKQGEKSLNHLTYPEKIIIPQDKLKKDCLYKLNDCYYDHDGEFLYRVPGMYN